MRCKHLSGFRLRINRPKEGALVRSVDVVPRHIETVAYIP